MEVKGTAQESDGVFVVKEHRVVCHNTIIYISTMLYCSMANFKTTLLGYIQYHCTESYFEMSNLYYLHLSYEHNVQFFWKEHFSSFMFFRKYFSEKNKYILAHFLQGVFI